MIERTARRWAWVLCLWAAPAVAQTAAPQPPARPASESIGSWVLTCPPHAPDPCLMRHRELLLPPGNGMPSAALEIQRRGTVLVPVIALRGLPQSAAFGGALVAQPSVTIGFDNGKRSALACGVDGTVYACAPEAPVVDELAAALPRAKSIAASVALIVPGLVSLPPQERSLELSGTEAALARLRAVGATGEALPEIRGLDIRGFLDRILRDIGMKNGADDVIPKLLPFVSSIWS